MRSPRRTALAIALVLLPVSALAATPSPSPKAPERVDLTKVQPKQALPKRALHTEFVVEINKLGQVTRVRSGKQSPDGIYNAQTYGNALQSFIRTADGRVVLGTYRLTYDYNPATSRIHRDVQLLRRGGVDPNRKGAALEMMAIAARHRNDVAPKPTIAKPQPRASVDNARLPDLPGVIKPSPTASPQ